MKIIKALLVILFISNFDGSSLQELTSIHSCSFFTENHHTKKILTKLDNQIDISAKDTCNKDFYKYRLGCGHGKFLDHQNYLMAIIKLPFQKKTIRNGIIFYFYRNSIFMESNKLDTYIFEINCPDTDYVISMISKQTEQIKIKFSPEESNEINNFDIKYQDEENFQITSNLEDKFFNYLFNKQGDEIYANIKFQNLDINKGSQSSETYKMCNIDASTESNEIKITIEKNNGTIINKIINYLNISD